MNFKTSVFVLLMQSLHQTTLSQTTAVQPLPSAQNADTNIESSTNSTNSNTSAEKYVPSKFTIDLADIKTLALNILSEKLYDESGTSTYSKSSKSSLIQFYSKKSKKGSSSDSSKSSKKGSSSDGSKSSKKGKGGGYDTTKYDFDIIVVSKNTSNATKINDASIQSSNGTTTNSFTTKKSQMPTSTLTYFPLPVSTSVAGASSTAQDSTTTSSDEVTTISALIGNSNSNNPNGSNKRVSISGVGIALIIVTLFALSLFAILFSMIVRRKKNRQRSQGEMMCENDEEICSSSFKKYEMMAQSCSSKDVPNDLTIDETYSDLDGNITSTNQSLSSETFDHGFPSSDEIGLHNFYYVDGNNADEMKSVDFSSTCIDTIEKNNETVVL